MAITLDSGAIRALAGPSGPVNTYLRGLARKTENRAQVLAGANRKTGQLGRSIRAEQAVDSQGAYWRVIADAPHAMAQHEGTRPHIIRARGKAALFFHWERTGFDTVVPRAGGFRTHVSKGGVLFIGKGHVNHPGTQGTQFLVRALEQAVRGG